MEEGDVIYYCPGEETYVVGDAEANSAMHLFKDMMCSRVRTAKLRKHRNPSDDGSGLMFLGKT